MGPDTGIKSVGEYRKCHILRGDWAQLPQEPAKEEIILSPAPGSIVTVTTVGNTIPVHTHQNLSVREPGLAGVGLKRLLATAVICQQPRHIYNWFGSASNTG